LRRCLVGQPQLGAARPFGPFGGARFEHQFQRANLLMRRGDHAARFVGFNSHQFEALLLHSYLDLAPLQQVFELAKHIHGQRDTRRWLLRVVNLHEHQADARLGGGEHGGLLLDAHLTLGEHAALLIQSATALVERHFERGVGSRLH
jgi:hypothetical protein